MLQELKQKFKEYYGDGQVECIFSPGRVNLIGEHTDYNGGHVFPCALSIGTYALARKNDCGKMRFYSLNFTRFGMLAVEGPAQEFTNVLADNWCNYPKGVMWAYTQKGYTIDSGLDILYYGNIPNGSGLSSSASIEVATAVILNDQLALMLIWLKSARSASLREQIQRRKLWYHGSVCYRNGKSRSCNLP